MFSGTSVSAATDLSKDSFKLVSWTTRHRTIPGHLGENFNGHFRLSSTGDPIAADSAEESLQVPRGRVISRAGQLGL